MTPLPISRLQPPCLVCSYSSLFVWLGCLAPDNVFLASYGDICTRPLFLSHTL